MIEIKHLSKTFQMKDGAVNALKDIDLTIPDGSIYGIIGMSGAGKSTLVRCINLLERPNQGEVRFHGRPITGRGTDASAYRTRVGMVFQSFNLFSNMNVLENCMAGPVKVLRRSREEARARALRYLEQVGMAPYINARPRQLSGGQKQRVALARTLVMKPRILLLDEPLSALDGVIKESIKDRIKTIAREYHLTTIIVTHDPEEALTLSDRVLIIDQGSISQYARPDEIVHQPRNDFVRKFILRQLEIKRGNIYALFGDRPQLAGEAV